MSSPLQFIFWPGFCRAFQSALPFYLPCIRNSGNPPLILHAGAPAEIFVAAGPRKSGVKTVICGGASEVLENMLWSAKIAVIGDISGEVDQVLQACPTEPGWQNAHIDVVKDPSYPDPSFTCGLCHEDIYTDATENAEPCWDGGNPASRQNPSAPSSA